MKTSETIVELTKALVEFERKVKGIKKDAQGHGYKYITLDSILALVRPTLAECGLTLIQDAGGAVVEGQNIAACQSRLLHVSGEWIETDRLEIKPVAVKSGMPTTPRDLGSAITYAKRYQLTALLGLSADVDDDAGAVSENLQNWGHKVNTIQLQSITSLMKAKGLNKESMQPIMIKVIGGTKQATDLTKDEADNLIAHLESM